MLTFPLSYFSHTLPNTWRFREGTYTHAASEVRAQADAPPTQEENNCAEIPAHTIILCKVESERRLGSPFPIRESHHLPRPSRVPDRARPRFGTANVQPCPALQEGEQKEIRGTPRACSRVQPPNTSKLTLHVAAGDQALHGSPALNLNLICNHTRTGPDPQRIPAVTTNERLEFPSRAPSPSFPPPPASPASAPLLVHPRYLRHVRKTFLGSGVT